MNIDSMNEFARQLLTRQQTADELAKRVHFSMRTFSENYQHQLQQLRAHTREEKEIHSRLLEQQQTQEQLVDEAIPQINEQLHEVQYEMERWQQAREQLQQLRQQAREQEEKMAALKEELSRQSQEFRNSIESEVALLQKYQRLLRLEVSAVSTTTIRFTFTDIDAKHRNRRYSVDLDVGESEFLVVASAPDLGENLLSLVEHEVNDHKSVGKFLKTVRNLFKETLDDEGASGSR